MLVGRKTLQKDCLLLLGETEGCKRVRKVEMDLNLLISEGGRGATSREVNFPGKGSPLAKLPGVESA